MKIRILGNSIRLRLTQTEVKDLQDKGKIEERAQLGITANEVLVYSLEKKEVEQITASFVKGHIRVFLPAKMTDNWAGSDQVGLSYDLPLNQGNTLCILIEKDFRCLTERGEDESDHFPNPAENC